MTKAGPNGPKARARRRQAVDGIDVRALLGERAHLEDGLRTSSIVAVTNSRVASVPGEALDRGALEQLSTGHRREDASAG